MQHHASAEAATANGHPAELAGRLPALFWFVVAMIFILAADLADGVLFLGDVDDRMRGFQIRDLLGDGQWYDRGLPFIAMPEPYVSPWSRLVDLPYVAVSWLLSPLIGAEAGLAAAMWLVPPLLGLGFAAFALSIMRAFGPAALAPVHLVGTAIVMTYALWEFTPGRIDHHNVQLVLMAAMVSGLVAARPLRGGALAGVAAVLSVAVGLECLPFIAAAFGARVISALTGDRMAATQMLGAAGALVLATPLAALALIGPQGMARTACDAFSAPWIAALLGTAPLLGMLSATSFRRLPVAGRFAVAGLGAATLGLVLVSLYPGCLDGPYAMIDATARNFWLDRVAQEESALALVADRRFGLLAVLGLCGFVVLAAASEAWSRMRAGDGRFAMVWLVAAAALALTLLQIRFVRFAPAFAPLLLPWLLFAISKRRPQVASLRLVVAGLVPAILTVALLLTVPERERRYDAVDLMTWDECTDADVSALAAVAAGAIIAPPGLSFTIAEGAVMRQHAHTVSSLSFHRAAPGISRVADAFTSSDAPARRAALASFEYLAVCQRQTRLDLSGAPLYAALMGGQGWPGLERIAGPQGHGLQLYRIDHARLH